MPIPLAKRSFRFYVFSLATLLAPVLLAPPGLAISYKLEVVAQESALLSGGVLEFPLILSELHSPDEQGYFGEFPFRKIDSVVYSYHSTPLEVSAITGLTVESSAATLTDGSEALFFEFTADPGVVPPADNTPINGLSTWQIGTLTFDVGPPIVHEDGIGLDPDYAILLDIEFQLPNTGFVIIQPELTNPDSGLVIPTAPVRQQYIDDYSDNTNDGEVSADGETVVIDQGLTNHGSLRATGGGTLDIQSTISSPGVIEALPGSVVTVSGGLLELAGRDTTAAFDNELTGGTLRTTNGTLNVAPAGYTLVDNTGTLELSGTQAATNLFDETMSSPGQIVSNLNFGNHSGGRFRLDQGVRFTLPVLDNGFESVIEMVGDSQITTTDGGNVDFVNFGLFVADGTFAGDIDNKKDVQIGDGDGQLGSLHVTGDLQLDFFSTLEVDLASPTQHDTLEVGGQLNLLTTESFGATLHVHSLGGYLPSDGQQFVIVTAEGFSDNFELVRDTFSTRDFFTTIDETAGTLILHAVEVPNTLLLGDADNDLAVSGSDLLAVTNNFGATGFADGLLLGDADDNGTVSGSDLLAVTNNFGATLSGSSFNVAPTSAVPEPSACVLCFVMALSSKRFLNRMRAPVF